MGLMDNLKATVKNAASKTGEVAETTTLKTRISNLEYETDKIYKELGMAYYNNEADFKEKSKDLCEKIKANLDQIENLYFHIGKGLFGTLQNIHTFQIRSGSTGTVVKIVRSHMFHQKIIVVTDISFREETNYQFLVCHLNTLIRGVSKQWQK